MICQDNNKPPRRLNTPKILILASWYPSPLWPSLGTFVREQAEALSRAGLSVDVLHPNFYSPKRILEQKKIILGYRKTTTNYNILYTLHWVKTHIPFIDRFIFRLMGKYLFRQYLKTNALPDIIHLHVFLAGEIAIWIKKKYDIPFVVTEHFSQFAREALSVSQHKIARRTYRESSMNMAVSEPFKQILQTKTGCSFSVLPNMVDTQFFQPDFSHQNDEVFTFINIANLVPIKQQAILIDAFALLYKENPSLHLVLVGEGQERNRLESKSKQLGLQDVVTFTGQVSKNEVRRYLQNSSCFVLPSLFETFSIVIIEALSCGVPVIASSSAGGPEWILSCDDIPGNAGIMAQPEKEPLAKAMKDIQLRQVNKKDLHYWVEKHFSEQAVIARLTQIYQDALDIE